MTLEKMAEDVWCASAPQTFFGWQLGTRMTLLRLGDRSLLLHSPVPIDDPLKREIDALGPVGHIVAPSLFHHLYAGEAARLYPDARLHGASGLEKKRPDLKLDAVLGSAPDPAWGDDVATVQVAAPALGETAFFHRPSRTLICSDLIQNFDTADDWWTRAYLKIAGISGKPGLSRLPRMAFRDKKEARRCIDQLLDWRFERVVLAHGEPIRFNAEEAFRDAYAWLKG